MTHDPETPRLLAVTRPLAEHPDLIALADPAQPMLWNRGDRGCVGIGEALRLGFSGAHRFAEAASAWRAIAARAHVDDPVRMPGSGLVALGAFAFDDRSGAESVLIVPRILVARHRGSAWITEVSVLNGERSAPREPTLPRPADPGPWNGARLDPLPGAGSGSASSDGSHRSVAAYLDGVREAGARIEHGDIEKIVLARQIEGELAAGDDLRVPLSRLSERYLDCWTFAVDGLVGASPETLIRSTGGAVSARVLAGTRGRHLESESRDRRARDELLTSAKEQHEHAFAVQSVVTALSPHVRELRTSDEPFPLQLPNVWHLATDLGASLGEESSALELVGALHPTAAVAGTPTSEAVEAIRELEPFDRGRYSGAVGWIDAAGDGEWVIALRCAQLGAPDAGVAADAVAAGVAADAVVAADPAAAASGRRSVVASAGGGIVAGSDPEHELGETVSKFSPIVDAFAP